VPANLATVGQTVGPETRQKFSLHVVTTVGYCHGEIGRGRDVLDTRPAVWTNRQQGLGERLHGLAGRREAGTRLDFNAGPPSMTHDLLDIGSWAVSNPRSLVLRPRLTTSSPFSISSESAPACRA